MKFALTFPLFLAVLFLVGCSGFKFNYDFEPYGATVDTCYDTPNWIDKLANIPENKLACANVSGKLELRDKPEVQ